MPSSPLEISGYAPFSLETGSARKETSDRLVGSGRSLDCQVEPAPTMSETINSLAGALIALLEVPHLAEQLRRNLELAEPLGRLPADKPLPPGVRSDIGRVAAALAFAPSLPELLRYADVVDFRDLNEDELAYLEGLSLKTIRRWRTQGTGPEYRCEAGISYPIRWVWEWREKGRQRLTGQKKTRGWRG